MPQLEFVDMHVDLRTMALLPPSEWKNIDAALVEILERAPIRSVQVKVTGKGASAIDMATILPQMDSSGLLEPFLWSV
jgi:hypothetical protein